MQIWPQLIALCHLKEHVGVNSLLRTFSKMVADPLINSELNFHKDTRTPSGSVCH